MYKIYFAIILILTLVAIYIYITNEQGYSKELQKIEILENNYQIKQKELTRLRSQTTPCHIDQLITPKTCFYSSNFECTWNENTDRCEKL
jgi:hypothetical protein